MRRAVAEARANIALIKYWGKRDRVLNLPANSSLSLTLDGMTTRTTVCFDSALAADRLILGGEEQVGEALRRVTGFLDLVRGLAKLDLRAHIDSTNSFPTASGLASSASGFAALAVAATHAAGLELSPLQLSVLARRGSGSAARSIFGGFVGHHCGTRPDGEDSFSQPIESKSNFSPRLVVAVTDAGKKTTLSTRGMEHTAATSPYYAAWTAMAEQDFGHAESAIAAGDLEALGVLTESSGLSMHASAMAARPAVVYFSSATLAGYHAICALRKSGIPAWFTCDAGPHIKALTDEKHATAVAARLCEVAGVQRTFVCSPGRGAELLERTQ